METLFEVRTERVSLTWSKVRGREAPILKGFKNISGKLILKKRSDNLSFRKIWRDSVPQEIQTDPYLEIGPLLFEETDYNLWVSTKTHSKVVVMHRDPIIIRNLVTEENGKILYGLINFGSQIG